MGTGGRGVLDALCLVGGVVLIRFGFIVLRRKRLLENIPTSRVRSVAMGFAELLGTAKQRKPLVAPFSGLPCVFYKYEVEEERREGRGGRRWVTIDHGTSKEPFYLADETGALLVDPTDAELVIECGYRHVEPGEGMFTGRKRYSEWWIVSGQKIFVAGTVWNTRDQVLERRFALSDRLLALKHDPEAMKAIDTDHDGTISTEEWGNAVRQIQTEVTLEAAHEPQRPPEEEHAIGKGVDEKTFVIAQRGEGPLLFRLRLATAGCLLGGPALVVVFSVSLLKRFALLDGGWIFPW